MILPVTTVPGDFNNDSVVDVTDVDLLRIAIIVNNSDPQFDLNGDLTLDPNDFSHMIETILSTTFGDVNLDGSVDAIDLAHMRDNTGFATGWADGNFDLNGVIDFSDLSQLRRSFGFAAPPIPVPEPTTRLSLMLLIVVLHSVAAHEYGNLIARRREDAPTLREADQKIS